MRLPKPKNQKAWILSELIKGPVTERDFMINGFRSRISELYRIGIEIKSRPVKFKNKFGHSGTYLERFLDKDGKKKAVRMYKSINEPDKN